jgi:CHAD domain-containing protein
VNQAIGDVIIMKKDVLSTYVRGHLKSAGRHLSDFAENRQSESLHALRVELKKIKAACSFAEFVFKDTCTTTPLKPLFKEAGKIRELQVHISLLSRFPHPPKRLIAQLELREKSLTESFVNNFPTHSDSLKDFRKNARLPKKEIDSKAILKYIAKMQDLRLPKNDAEELHSCRIRIKRMMHVYYMLPDKIQKKTNLDIESIEQLQDELGDWHDLHTAIHFLSGETVPKRAAEHILKLKEQESSLYETLKDKLSPIPDPQSPITDLPSPPRTRQMHPDRPHL